MFVVSSGAPMSHPSPFLPLALGLTPSLVFAHPAGGEQRLAGGQAGAQFGRALATGDVNSDGFGDLLVGAPGFDARVSDEGRVTLYLGSAAGLSLVPSWSATGLEPFEHFGASVSVADVNGDGKADVLVSSPDFDRRPSSRALLASLGHGRGNGLSSEGRVSVFLGTPGGLAAAPQRVLTGIEFGEHFGAALAGAGDVNGDGYEDVLVGATGKLGGFGGVFLFAGSPSGLRALPGWIRIGASIGEGWGSVLASAGDVSADGFADFILAAPFRSFSHRGRAELFLGSSLGPGSVPDQSVPKGMVVLGPTATLDSSGPTTFFVTAPTTIQVEWRHFLGADAGSFAPLEHAVSSLAIGDLNGDGREDVLFGTPSFEYGPFHGRAGAYTNLPGLALSPTPPFPVFDGDQAGAEWGAALAAIDVDGDGADEFFIGAPRYDAGETDEGLVALEPGHAAELSLTTTGPEIPFGGGVGAGASGDFDGDGFDDLVTVFGTTHSASWPRLETRYGSPAGLTRTPDSVLHQPSFPGYDSTLISLLAGDFDGDGFADVVATFFPTLNGSHGGLQSSGEGHWLYRGSSSGLVRDPVVALMGSGSATDAGDVNGDGRDDLVTGGSAVRVFFGTSTGLDPVPSQSFAGIDASLSDGRAILAGNLNGDAFADVVIARAHGAQVSILLGSPSGLVLQRNQTDLPVGDMYLALADVNGDGLDDLLLRKSSGFSYRTYLGSPNGFTRAEQWWESPSTFARVVFDADLDGRPDLLLGNRNRLHRGSPAGVERSPSWLGAVATFPDFYSADAISGEPFAAPVRGDFDGDGRLECVVRSAESQTGWTVVEIDEL